MGLVERIVKLLCRASHKKSWLKILKLCPLLEPMPMVKVLRGLGVA